MTVMLVLVGEYVRSKRGMFIECEISVAIYPYN